MSTRNFGKLIEFKPEEFDSFKSTTTIFVLSNAYEKSEYEKLLSEVWTVTPFRVVDAKDFSFVDYTSNKYSFATLDAYYSLTDVERLLISQIRFSIFDQELYDKKIKKKNKKQNIDEFIRINTKFFGCINLNASNSFINFIDKEYIVNLKYSNPNNSNSFNAVSENLIRFNLYKSNFNEMNEALKKVYFDKETFTNYKLGYLKNYFQKIDKLIKSNSSYWLFGTDFTAESKKIKTQILYIPQNLKLGHDGWGKVEDYELDEKEIKKIFGAYEYKYEFVDSEFINSKILNNEEIYYLRFVRSNIENFFQIVNSLTGEVVLRLYRPGAFNYNIKEKDFKEISKMISKG